MQLIDIVIIAVVAVGVIASFRAVFKGASSSCSSCGHAGSCGTHEPGSGSCTAAQDMLKKAEASLDAKGARDGHAS